MKTQITDLFGMHVYTDKAVLVGEIEDVVVDVDGKKIDSLAVSNINPELMDLKGFRGLRIPYRIIIAIGDIVIIRHLTGAFGRMKQE
ncbi:MAG: PRC-barrel domain-containing protein [Methanomicrobiaceae archaeon]|nr:PRC-barrel domain-containing protein [Methanomicrobiaceae archaeon]